MRAAAADAAPAEAPVRETPRAQQLVRAVEDLRYTTPPPRPRPGAIDINAVITRALTAAGLMK